MFYFMFVHINAILDQNAKNKKITNKKQTKKNKQTNKNKKTYL